MSYRRLEDRRVLNTSVINTMHCGVESQFLVIEDRGRNDNDCNRTILRDHRTVFDMKPSGRPDETLRMVTTVLTRVVTPSRRARSKLSGQDRERYDCNRTIPRDHRNPYASCMRSSDRLYETPRTVGIVLTRVAAIIFGSAKVKIVIKD